MSEREESNKNIETPERKSASGIDQCAVDSLVRLASRMFLHFGLFFLFLGVVGLFLVYTPSAGTGIRSTGTMLTAWVVFLGGVLSILASRKAVGFVRRMGVPVDKQGRVVPGDPAEVSDENSTDR